MIKKLTSLKKAVKGQTIKDLVVADDDTFVSILFESGDLLRVSAALIPSMSVPATLEVQWLTK
jgi:hypothetical protein